MAKSWLGLEEKTVMVTGGASGIGKAIAKEYLNNGANVAVLDIADNVPDFKSERVIYIKTDVTDRSAVKSAVEETISTFGQVDILVNNAGINIPRLLVDPKDPEGKYELDEAVFDIVMNVNVKGVFFCAQEVAREMVKKGSGVIINISSECALEGSEGQSIYAATKGAMDSFTRSWAKELGKHGVRVVGVAPGILEETGLRTIEYETALAYTRGITVEDLRAGYERVTTIPLSRVARLDEAADLVCYLGSHRASYVHGVTYNISGGKTRG
ncbi:MAG: SDR family oxidoreductase [Clostridiales bacterium]|nr:SDR family oxidoreductase [Clostridiales bacterium]